MKQVEYGRVMSRGVAIGNLGVLVKTVDEFRFAAELAGIKVNEKVVIIKALLDEFSEEIRQASLEDTWNLKR